MTDHHLKTKDPWFEELWSNKKTFEYRKNDRDFQVGDKLVLYEYDEKHDEFSGRRIRTLVTSILHVADGYSVMSLCAKNTSSRVDESVSWPALLYREGQKFKLEIPESALAPSDSLK